MVCCRIVYYANYYKLPELKRCYYKIRVIRSDSYDRKADLTRSLYQSSFTVELFL